MAQHITVVVGEEKANELRSNVWDMLGEGADYNDIEDMLLGEGLEMDYIMDLI